MSRYVDALEAKVLALRKQEADARSIREVRPDVAGEMLAAIRDEREILKAADIYYWSDDMLRIVAHVASSFPVDAPFSRTWLTTRVGWYWLGRSAPLMATVTRRRLDGEYVTLRERVCAILYQWDEGEQGVKFGAYTEDHLEPTRGPTIIFGGTWCEGETFQHFIDKQRKLEAEGIGGYKASLDGSVKVHWLETGAQAARFFMAASLWMQQKIIEVRKSPSIRNRAVRRAGIAKPQVLIVQLRRKEYIKEEQEHATQPVEWSCRWWVRGHWRNQFYKAENVHKPVWVDRYIKGPDDKPLKEPGQTFAVIR